MLWRAKAPERVTAETHAGTGPVIYYRDPDGPFYAAEPKKNAAGKDYVAVRASEDVSFEDKPSAPGNGGSRGRRIRYYRNPMGLPD
ncbi:MAG: efflux transporter periplasmic adaptor subunit, partial [Methylocystis sp.]